MKPMSVSDHLYTAQEMHDEFIRTCLQLIRLFLNQSSFSSTVEQPSVSHLQWLRKEYYVIETQKARFEKILSQLRALSCIPDGVDINKRPKFRKNQDLEIWINGMDSSQKSMFLALQRIHSQFLAKYQNVLLVDNSLVKSSQAAD